MSGATPTSVVTSATDNLRQSNRRVLVVGARASGKTTFSMSASRCAGLTLPAPGEVRETIACNDTLVIQGDNEGIMGAMDAGLEPKFVVDMTAVPDWSGYTKRLSQALHELERPLHDGTIRVVIIDLGLPAKLIDRSIDPSVQKDWKLVANEGARLFRALSGLRGVTVIGNAQIKASVGMVNEAQATADAATAKAIGGERSTFTVDLPKGIAALWLDNCSFVFTREARRVKGRDGNTTRAFRTLTQSSSKYEAKSRAESKLAPTEDGKHTLHALLTRAYGEGL